MNKLYSEQSYVFKALPDQINTLLSEYRDGHRAIEPEPYFLDLYNSGNNSVHVKMNLSGITHEFTEEYNQPFPLRVIVEFDMQIDAVIVTVLERTMQPFETSVTISTFSSGSPYLASFIGSMFSTGNLRENYLESALSLMHQQRSYENLPHAV